MRESKFSTQVIQPFYSFPVQARENHHDRLFKHVTFTEDDADVKLRITSMNNNWSAQHSVVAKRVSLKETDWSRESDKVRLKAFFSLPVDGVKESYWVHQHHADYGEAEELNQYRVRSVSNEGYFSDWVYSELRDKNNDLIVYEMLHDLLDVLLYMNDDDLEYRLAMMVQDVFSEIMIDGRDRKKGKTQDIKYILEADEQKRLQANDEYVFLSDDESSFQESAYSKLSELSSIFSRLIKSSVTETIGSSLEEFTEFMQTYRILDRIRMNEQDILSVILESVLFKNIICDYSTASFATEINAYMEFKNIICDYSTEYEQLARKLDNTFKNILCDCSTIF
jgi:hypothetical protein